jgi:hypothetical protein
MRQAVLPALVCLTASLALAGVSRPQPPRQPAEVASKLPALPAPVVPGVRRAVEAEVAGHLADEQARRPPAGALPRPDLSRPL